MIGCLALAHLPDPGSSVRHHPSLVSVILEQTIKEHKFNRGASTRIVAKPPEDIALLGKELFGSNADQILSQARSFQVDVGPHHLDMFTFKNDDAAMRLPYEFLNDPYKTIRLAPSSTRQPSCGKLQGMASNNLVVDIGANLGAFSISAFLANPQLRILALEPVPTTFLFLKWNLQSNGIHSLTEEEFRAGHPGVLALQRAVTKDGRDVNVEYSPSQTMNAITEASASSQAIPDAYDVKRKDAVRTSVHSLVLPSFVGDDPVSFMKIDCEGCEHEVVPGWFDNGFLKKVDMLSGEVHQCLEEHSCRYSRDVVANTKSALMGHPGWA